MLSDLDHEVYRAMVDEGLNAPFGVRCFLTKVMSEITKQREMGGLNAPFGARCFLTMSNRSVASTFLVLS